MGETKNGHLAPPTAVQQVNVRHLAKKLASQLEKNPELSVFTKAGRSERKFGRNDTFERRKNLKLILIWQFANIDFNQKRKAQKQKYFNIKREEVDWKFNSCVNLLDHSDMIDLKRNNLLTSLAKWKKQK